MDFEFSSEQIEMRDSMARVFNDLCSDAAIKELHTQTPFFHKRLWLQLTDSGLFSLPFDEAFGGLGLSLVDLCLIIELQGANVAPIPLISSLIEAGLTIAESDNAVLKERLIADCMAGKIFSPVRPYTGLLSAEGLSISNDRDGFILNGRSGFVPYAALADGLVIEASTEQGDPLLLYCDSNMVGIDLVEQTAITDEPAGYLVFNRAHITHSQVIAQGEQAQMLLARQRQRCHIALGALQLGCLEAGLQRTAEYVSERKQFGRALGSFQAVSQQAADAYMEIESLRSVYWRALDDVELGEDLALSAAVVKYWVAEAGHKAAHIEMHLHGGIGQDLEYPIHRYFLFAKQCERYAGSPVELTSEVGRHLLSMNPQRLKDQCL